MEDRNIASVNVMLITNGRIKHYCYIKNLSRLLSEQHSKHHHAHFCVRCLQGFLIESVLEKRRTLCRGAASHQLG